MMLNSSAKKQKLEAEKNASVSLIVQFQNEQNDIVGPQLQIPSTSTTDQMEEIINQLLENGDKKTPYSFYVDDDEIIESLQNTIAKKTSDSSFSTESALTITFRPLALIRVRPVSRCTDTLQGHTEAVLHVSFSPDGKHLASGGGDATVRFWDTMTCFPKKTCRGHRNHVLCTAWSPLGDRFISGDRNGEIRVWNPTTGEQSGQPLKGHRQWITSFAWEPLHRNATAERFASSSKDGSVKIWNARTGKVLFSLTSHTDSVEVVKWGGEGLIYSASRDRTIKVWAVNDEDANSPPKLIRTLTGHGHRINTLALSCESVCRSGPFGLNGEKMTFKSKEEAQAQALEKYNGVKGNGPERIVSGSDDFTMFLWEPMQSKTPIQRLTGHVQPVNHIAFSPDGSCFASASFDKKIKLWNGKTGRFIATLTGHVGAVYQVSWSSDSRLVVSASKDSTIKVWDRQKPKVALKTLPGHADEVYALDWAPNGLLVASGSKDRTIKVWRQ